MGYAYWTDRVRDAMTARDAPEFARLAAGGPWQFRDASYNGVRGVLAEWLGSNEPVEHYGPARTCVDGLVYLPSATPLRQDDLAKANAPRGTDYTTSRGVTLTIPLAAAAPRFLSFGAGAGLGEAADEFAALAWDVFDSLPTQRFNLGDPRIVRLILLAVGQSYRVTAEALDDLRWITTADVEPILLHLMGASGKALPGDSEPSPSQSPGYSTSPSHPEKPQALPIG